MILCGMHTTGDNDILNVVEVSCFNRFTTWSYPLPVDDANRAI